MPIIGAMRKRGLAGAGVVAIAAAVLLWLLPSAAYREGVAAAEADIAAGRPQHALIGMPDRRGPLLHVRTGLPFRLLGCRVTPKKRDWASGYNATIAAALESGRLPEPRLKKKFFRPRALLELFEAGPVHEFELGGAPLRVTTDDGAREVRFRPEANPPGWKAGDLVDRSRAKGSLGLYRAGSETAELAIVPYDHAVSAVLTHDGATLVVRESKGAPIRVIDLPTRRIIATYVEWQGQLCLRGTGLAWADGTTVGVRRE